MRRVRSLLTWARPLPALFVALALSSCTLARGAARHFDGARAYQDVVAQCDLGARVPGSDASREARAYIREQLRRAGWPAEEEEFEFQGIALHNVTASQGRGSVIILGAHYDCRARSDRDPEAPMQPVPGADDGASGVAVLLELARCLDVGKLGHTLHLAFFDAEDQGMIDGWPWSVGARQLATHLDEKPELVIVVDMVGDADQQLYWERSSTPALCERVWAVADELGYADYFVPQYRHHVLDDHTPFLENGIPALDIIDFDYPYWHTTADTPDKVSAASLERVGRVLESLLEDGAGRPDR